MPTEITNILLRPKDGNLYHFMKILAYIKNGDLYEYKLILKLGNLQLLQDVTIDTLTGKRTGGVPGYIFSRQLEISYHAETGNITYKDAQKNYNLSPRYRYSPLRKLKKNTLFFHTINLPINFSTQQASQKQGTNVEIELPNYAPNDTINCDFYISNKAGKFTIPPWSKKIYQDAEGFLLEDTTQKLYLNLFIFRHIGKSKKAYFGIPNPRTAKYRYWTTIKQGKGHLMFLDFLLGGIYKVYRKHKK